LPPMPTGKSQYRAGFRGWSFGLRPSPVLLRAGQRSHTVTIPFNQPSEGRPGSELHQLREPGLADVHGGLEAETSQPGHPRDQVDTTLCLLKAAELLLLRVTSPHLTGQQCF
jgi:hypothetical protein